MRHRMPIFILALAMVAPAMAQSNRDDETNETRRASASAEVIRELAAVPDGPPRPYLVERAVAVLVVPFLASATYPTTAGNGVLSVRMDGNWSEPVFVKLVGGKIDFQAGATSTDIVLFFMSDEKIEPLLDGVVVLGENAYVAVGPMGRDARLSTSSAVDVYAYARTQGSFSGVAISGAEVSIDKEALARVYGGQLNTQDVIWTTPTPGSPGYDLSVALNQLLNAPQAGAGGGSSGSR